MGGKTKRTAAMGQKTEVIRHLLLKIKIWEKESDIGIVRMMSKCLDH